MAERVEMLVVKRNGSVVPFDPQRIEFALQHAYQAANVGLEDGKFNTVFDAVVAQVKQLALQHAPHVEEIQDLIEAELVHNDLYQISKKYILYREKQHQQREQKHETRLQQAKQGVLRVKKRNGTYQSFSAEKIVRAIHRVSKEIISEISIETIINELPRNIFDGITSQELEQALILTTTALIEQNPAYRFLAARLLLQKGYKQIAQTSLTDGTFDEFYRTSFVDTIKSGIANHTFATALKKFDLNALAVALAPERDSLFNYLGIQTLYERYFVRFNDIPMETPQAFWMRVAMGLAINEDDINGRAIEFYEVLSTMRFICSTPTLFHSGLSHPQLSSCYLSTVGDDLKSIFKIFSDNAQLSKWSGGIGNDWTPIRSTGAIIKTTNVESQGVIPFLKIANDTTVAINRSGKRRGATCAYLESWHLDIEDFLDLRRNTGDDRRRTHDMNTANWIPDLFMKRLKENGMWTLFSPDEVPDLHDIYGRKFEERYCHYEQQARDGKIRKYREVSATKLWRKMLTRLFETGHPWITFKDPCNVRSPQDHCGVVHNSNLCTEVVLNNSETETAVCNLGSINLARHIDNGDISRDILSQTISSAVRMLDNVIDINFYPTQEAENSNRSHRPIGLGIMGLQDVLFVKRYAFEDARTISFTDELMEFVSYHTILNSSKLAKERGSYKSYKNSKWSKGILPLDTVVLLEKERGEAIRVNRNITMDWSVVRKHIEKHGMRNSNTMAIAPTATISNISGCFPCIEPIYKNLYVKANMNGEFTVINDYLVADLKKHGLWDEEMIADIKFYDGDIGQIGRIPADLKNIYKTAFDIDPKRLIDLTAVRSKWIDQSQSHNVFIKGTSGKKLHDTYLYAWEAGLKTTYYLRSLAVSQVEKSTLSVEKYGYTQKRTPSQSPTEGTESNSYDVQSSYATVKHGEQPELATVDATDNDNIDVSSDMAITAPACKIDDPDCEVCQ